MEKLETLVFFKTLAILLIFLSFAERCIANNQISSRCGTGWAPKEFPNPCTEC